MSNNRDGIGTIFINNKNYKGLKVGTSPVKRKYNIPDKNGYTVLKIKCSTESNILNIFNQLTSNIESIEIFNESNININTNTTLPDLNMDNGSTNQYTTWTLPNGNYKVFIKGEFSIKDSTCEILKVKLQNNLTTGYKMFYNCNIVKANLDYGIKIPDSMTDTKSMFENSNIDHTAEINLLTTTRCSAMYKNCTNLKKIHINYIDAFNNESTLCPNLSESDYDECFFGCGNIRCGNLNSDTNNKPTIFSWANIPYSWGGLGHFNVFEIEANNTNGLTLTLAEHLFETINNDNESITYTPETLVRTDWGDGTIDNELSHTYNKSGTYIVKTRLQPNNLNAGSENKLIKKVINVRNDISNFGAFCYGCLNMEQFNIDNKIYPIDMVGMFYDCPSLTSIDMTKFDTTNTINLGLLFYYCTSLNTIIGLEKLNVENVKAMPYAFAKTSITNLDLSKWGCTNINNIIGLFEGCKKLRSVNLTGWNISNINSLIKLFNECYELTSIKGIEDWDTSNVESMSGTFRELRALKTLDLSKWDVSKVNSMYGMFEGCSSLETPGDLSNWTTPALTDAERMFNGNSKIKSLKLTNFNTSGLTKVANMFNGCTGLEEYDIVITFGNNNTPFDETTFDSSIKYITIKGTPDVTKMTSFVSILKDQTDTGATLDISQLSDEIKSSLMGNATLVNNARAKGWTFRQYSLDNLEYFNIFEIEANSTNGMSLTLYENPDKIGEAATYTTEWGDGTADNNTSHTYLTAGTYTIKTKLQSGSNALENNNIIECKNIRNDITNMEGFFCNFKALSKVSSIPNGVTNMVRCFKNCIAFNQRVTLPNTIKEVIYIFEGCSSFNQSLIIPEGPISLEGILKNCTSFNQSIELPSSTTNLNFAFYNCSSFNKPITIPGSVTSLKFSLQGCSSFNHPITIPNRATNIGAMFRGCTSFNQPVIIPDSVENMEQTFYDCNSLNSPITIGSGVTNMIAAFHQCGVFNQDIEIPNSVTDLTYMLQNCNSYNSLVTFNLTSDSNQTLDNIFAGASVSNIKIKGEITNTYMNRILGILVNPTTIDILELSNPNILSIIEDETIMNTINTGKQGTPHTLLWAEPTYNYFIVEPNDTNGLSINLYENEPLAGPASTLSLSGNQTDWGDGNIDENSTHTYISGKYLVKTKLQSMNKSAYFDYWRDYTGDNNDYIEPVNPITKCMSIRRDIDNMDYFFCENCLHLTYVCEIPENITSMFLTFSYCIEFNQKFNIPNNVINIDGILTGCPLFNQTLEIPNSVTSMEGCFMNCIKFNQPITIPNGVTNISYMLGNCEKFNQPLVIPNSVINAESLFSGCTSFNQPITIPDSVTNMEGIFYSCASFNQPLVIPDGVTNIAYLLSGRGYGERVDMAFNSPITIPDSVTDMSFAFYHCILFNQPVHISNNCTTMESCFDCCYEFNQPLEIPSSVTNISNGIYNCAKMESKVTFNFNAGSTINFDSTSFFSSPIKEIKIKGYCSNDRLINLSDNLSASSATIDIMELSNANILSIIEDTNVKTSIDSKGHTLLWAEPTYNYFVVQPNATNGTSLTLYENNDKSGDISAYSVDWGDETIDNNSSHTYSSENKYLVKTKLQPNNINTKNDNKLIKKVINIRNDISNLSYFCYRCLNIEQFYCSNIMNATNMCSMFYECKSLTSLDVSNFNTSNVTDMSWMFHSCNSLTSLDLSNFDTSKVNNMSNMFSRCTALNSLNVSNFNTINVTNMSYMFSYCESLTLLDVTNFNTSKVTRIIDIFNGCTSLTSLDLSNFNTSNVTNMEYMFYNCNSLTSLNLSSSFDTSNVTSMPYMFHGCNALTSLDVSNFNTNSASNMGYMFSECSSLTSLDVSNFDTSNVTDMYGMFVGCSSLTSLDVSNFNTSNVIKMGYMFNGCNKLTSLNVSNFNTSSVTDMQYMFYNCSSLTSLNVSNFDTSNVTSMKDMFCNCRALTSLNVSNFDTSKVTDMKDMFRECNNLTLLDVSNFDTSNVTDMYGMFVACFKLTSLDLSKFNTSKLNDIRQLCYNCQGLKSLDLTSFVIGKKYTNNGYSLLGVPSDAIVKVTSSFEKSEASCNWDGEFYIVDLIMRYTYTGTSDILPTLPSNYTYTLKDVTNADGSTTRSLYNSDWIGPNTYSLAFGNITDKNNITSIDYMRIDNNCTDLSNCFNICESITNINFSKYSDTSNVTNMYGMFGGCSNLASLNISGFNTSKVTDMGHMFVQCSSLTLLDLSNFDTSNVNNMEGVFSGCSNLASLNISGFNTSKVTNMEGMFEFCSPLTSLDVSNFNTSKVTNMNSMFLGCDSITSLNVSSFNTSNVTNMNNMFRSCSKLTSLDVSNFTTSNVTNMSYMFYDCIALTSLDLSSFNTSKVTNMGVMFYNCNKLTSLDLSNFDTSNVIDTGGMFQSCKALTSLNLSSFNTSNVTTMKNMFNGCTALTSLDVSSFNTSKVERMDYMFFDCRALTSLDLSSFNTINVYNMSYMFRQCYNLESLNLSSFDTSNVTGMGDMFAACRSLTSLDLSNFNTSKVTLMNTMFYQCWCLTKLDLSNFDTSAVTSITSMFESCNSLKSLDLTSFNINSSVNSENSLLSVPSNAIVRVTSSFEKTEADCNWTGTFKRPIAYYKYTNLVEDGDNSYIRDTSGNNYNISLGFLPTEVTDKGIHIKNKSSSPEISYPITENGFTIKYKVYNMDAGSGAQFFKCMSGNYTYNLGWWIGVGNNTEPVKTKNVWFKNTRYLSDNDFMDENSSPMVNQFNEVVLSMNSNNLYLNINGVTYHNTTLNINSSLFDSLSICLVAHSSYTQSSDYYFYKAEVYNEYLEI